MEPIERHCDVLVLGGGRAGTRAANIAAHRGGAVTLLSPTTNGWLHPTVEHVKATPWGVFTPGDVGAVIDDTPIAFHPRTLVLALPPYPIPEPIPGWALPGVVTIDDIANPQGRVVLAGAGAGLRRTARRLATRGCDIVAIVPADLLRCEGSNRFEALILTDGTRIPADVCVLHAAWVPDTTPARTLGIPCHATAGLLLPDATPGGTTPVPGVFLAPHTSQVWPRPHAAAFSPTDIVCRCEQISAATIRHAMSEGATSVPTLKRATRAGMGPCQGRLCSQLLHAFCGPAPEPRHTAPRAPLHPTPAALLARQASIESIPLAAPPTTRWTTAPPAQAPAEAAIAIIGAGIVGLSAALHLARHGQDVLLLDRAEPGMGASTANAGSLHVQLLPEAFGASGPGPLADALALGPASIALWRELAAAANETLGIRTEGGLILAATAADMAWLARKAEFERTRGIDTRLLGANELAALAPTLSRHYAGATFCAQEGQIDPLRGTAALLRLARHAGVRIVPGLHVIALSRQGPAWRIETSGGPIRAGQVLNAAGAHAATIGALAGLALPVRAVVQQVIATAPAPPLLRHLVAQAGVRLSLKQGDAGHLLIGGGWPGRLDASGATRLARPSIEASLWTAIQALPALATLDVVRAWTGLTVHLDRSPILSATPGHRGLFHAVTSNGYTLGPIAGHMLAEAMLGHATLPESFAL